MSANLPVYAAISKVLFFKQQSPFKMITGNLTEYFLGYRFIPPISAL